MKSSVIQNRTAACALAVGCTMLWGTAFPFIKLGYREFGIADGDVGSMLLFAGLRFSLAGILVILFLCAKERRPALPQKPELAPIILLGVIQTAGQYFCTYFGIGRTTGTNTSIITACGSFLTVLFAPLFFKSDRLTLLKLLGCAVGFAGVLVINRWGGFGLDTLFGDFLIFMSTVFASGGNLIAKGFSKGKDPVSITGWQLLLGGLMLTLAGLLGGGRLDLSNLRGLLILLWLALVSAVAFTVWTALLKHHPAGKIAVFNLLVPVFGTALSGLLLGENVWRWEALLSLMLIAAGIVLVNISRGEKND